MVMPLRRSGRSGAASHLPGERGFTLLEILLTISILTIGLLALSAMIITGMRGNTYSRKLEQATTLGQDKMEALKNTAYASLAGGSDSSGGINRSWTVGAFETGVKEITVTCSWTDAYGKSRQVVLKTLRSE